MQRHIAKKANKKCIVHHKDKSIFNGAIKYHKEMPRKTYSKMYTYRRNYSLALSFPVRDIAAVVNYNMARCILTICFLSELLCVKFVDVKVAHNLF